MLYFLYKAHHMVDTDMKFLCSKKLSFDFFTFDVKQMQNNTIVGEWYLCTSDGLAWYSFLF